MKVFASVICVLVLAASFSMAVPVRGAPTYLTPTIQSSPGTVAGTADDVARDDGSRATWTETDPTNIVGGTTWLRPNGDATPNQWGTTPATCGAGTHWSCVSDNPIQDGNTSYIWILANGVNKVDNQTIADLPFTDITVNSVTSFTWARDNTTAGDDYTLRIEDGVSQCATQNPVLTLAYANYSTTFNSKCSGGAWTTANVNAITQVHVKGGNIGGDTQEVTAAGVVVNYDDHDFQVQAYLNFTQVPSNAQLALYYKGSNSLPASETLSLQVDRGPTGGPAAWATLITPFLTAVEGQYNTLTLNPATDLVNGLVRFRVLDVLQNDETGGTFALNWFSIRVDPNSNSGGGTGNIFDLSCSPGLVSLSCTITLRQNASAITILRTSWYIGGAYAGEGSSAGRSHSFTALAWLFPAGVLNVTVTVLLSNSQIIPAGILVPYDNAWFLVVLIVVALLVSLGILSRVSRLRAVREKASKHREDREAAQRTERRTWEKVFPPRR